LLFYGVENTASRLFTFDNLLDDKDAEFLVRSRPFFELEFDNVD